MCALSGVSGELQEDCLLTVSSPLEVEQLFTIPGLNLT